jgi:pyruvate/2-oxoglutarate/acetoin dehydrogenase E1 component
MYLRKGPVRRGAVAQIGQASVERTGVDVTIVATMLMVERSLEAARLLEAEGIDVEVIDLRWISPLDVETVTSSVEKTGRLVVAEEQWHDGGWGATLISRLTMHGVRTAAQRGHDRRHPGALRGSAGGCGDAIGGAHRR